jgi:UDP-N-acetylglucosamine 2-epimerase (non-hydrolysing)
VMIDVLLATAAALDSGAAKGLETRPAEPFTLATIHRAENTDNTTRLAAVINALAAIETTVLLPLHPRLRDRCAAADIDLNVGNLRPIDPLSYAEMVDAARTAVAVATDSGGLQKEAFVLGRPVTTLRSETEWTETLADGWNVLEPDLKNLSSIVLRRSPREAPPAVYGHGHAADAVINALIAAN